MPEDARGHGRADADRTLSAQVVVRSGSGKRLGPGDAITSRNIHEYAPSGEDAAAAREGFRAAGFETGEVVGISFSITAPLSRFERFFGIGLEVDEQGAVAAAGSPAPAGGLELPLDALPSSLAGRLVAVAFSPPAELYGGEASLLF